MFIYGLGILHNSHQEIPDKTNRIFLIDFTDFPDFMPNSGHYSAECGKAMSEKIKEGYLIGCFFVHG